MTTNMTSGDIITRLAQIQTDIAIMQKGVVVAHLTPQEREAISQRAWYLRNACGKLSKLANPPKP